MLTFLFLITISVRINPPLWKSWQNSRTPMNGNAFSSSQYVFYYVKSDFLVWYYLIIKVSYFYYKLHINFFTKLHLKAFLERFAHACFVHQMVQSTNIISSYNLTVFCWEEGPSRETKFSTMDSTIWIPAPDWFPRWWYRILSIIHYISHISAHI